MPSAFDLFGALRLDTQEFQNSCRDADARMTAIRSSISSTEAKAQSLGITTATSARNFEKLTDAVNAQKQKLGDLASAFDRGDLSSKKFASGLQAVEKAAESVNNKVKDAQARLTDYQKTGNTPLGNHFDQLQSEIKGASSELSNLTGILTGDRLSGATSQITSLSNSITAIPGPAGIAVGAIAAIGTTALAAGASLYEMGKSAFESAKSAAEAGKQVGTFSYITGFGVQTSSALNYALSLMGKNLTDVQRPMVFFGRLLDQAADGSDKAQQKLAKLGITKFDNLQVAFEQAAQKVDSTSNAVERMGLVTSAFGARGGADMEKVFKKMGGNVDEFTQKATEMGVVLSTQNVRDAQAFTHAYETLSYQIKMIADRFALEYAPQITRAMEEISEAVTSNHDKINHALERTGDFARGLATIVKDSNTSQIASWTSWAFKVHGLIDPIAGSIQSLAKIAVYAAGKIADLGKQNTGDLAGAQIGGSLGRHKVIDPNLNLLTAQAGTDQFLMESYKAYAARLKQAFYGKDPSVDDLGDDAEKASTKTDKLKDSIKATKDAIIDASKAWTASSLADFAKGQGFIPGSGFVKGGHNENSLHYQNKALDIGLNTNQRSAKQIADFLEKAIESGIRVVDERTRFPGEKVWSGPHIHLEENDKKPSYLNPSFDYAGKYDLLKALDTSRLTGKGKDVSNVLLKIQQDAQKTSDALEKAAATGMKEFTDKFQEIIDLQSPSEKALQALNNFFNSEDVTKGIDKRISQFGDYEKRLFQIFEDTLRLDTRLNSDDYKKAVQSEGSGRTLATDTTDGLVPGASNILDVGPPPAAKAAWTNFWDTLQQRMDQFEATLPTLRTAIGENLVSSIEKVGDVFGSALNAWLTHSQSFFSALRQGFAQLISSIISELIRLMVMKAVLSLIGSFAGGAGGGGDVSFTDAFTGGLGGTSAAEGGMISGPGTGTSDSIFARLSNGEFVMKAAAVKHWGAGFFDRLNNMAMPQMAFASGGYVGGGSSSTSYDNRNMGSYHVHLNVPPATNGATYGQQTLDQLQRAAAKGMQMALKRVG